MKWSVGYQCYNEYEEPLADSLCEMADRIDEVYFPWMDLETCRASTLSANGQIPLDSQAFLERDLKLLKNAGIKLNLLLNANCYGEKSISNSFKNSICSSIDRILDIAGELDCVTTTSPFIAQIVKQYYKKIKTRASVNMRIGTIKGMQYLQDSFDGFYLQREYNRDFEQIRLLKDWTDKNDKSLHLLVNSGCLSFCSGQTFHDNTVSHEKVIAEMNNVKEAQTAICWSYYKEQSNWVSLLQNTWIRPEDIKNYESLFSTAKLATRMTSRPLSVINAYINEKYNGNLLDLMEPNHTPLLNGSYISNRKFPEDWFKNVSQCKRECHTCNYCSDVLQKVMKKIDPSNR